MQAYIQRADSLKMSLLNVKHLVPTTLTFENVVEDYCEAHGRNANFKAIAEAVLVAIDHGKYLRTAIIYGIILIFMQNSMI